LSKTHVLSEYKTEKKHVAWFFATLTMVNIFVRDGEKHFFEEICDGVLCKAAESFEDEACST